VRKLDGSPAVRLAEGEGYGFSPDGRFALTVKLPERRPIILVPTGVGESKSLDVGNITFAWANWFPDGKRILVNGREGGKGGPRLFVLDVAGGAPKPISSEGVSILGQSISPDGRSIVARQPDGRVAIYPADGNGEPRPVPGLEPEEVPMRWTPDGRSIYVTRLAALPGVIDVVEIATGRRTKWKEFQPVDASGVEQAGPAMISPDGTTYVYSFRRVLGDLFLATGMK
jgi:Tol biopolymer transport system component